MLSWRSESVGISTSSTCPGPHSPFGATHALGRCSWCVSRSWKWSKSRSRWSRPKPTGLGDWKAEMRRRVGFWSGRQIHSPLRSAISSPSESCTSGR